MNIPAHLLPAGWLIVAHVVFAIVLILAIRQAPWGRLRSGRDQHVFLGSVVGLLLLWSLEAGIAPGLGFHFLGATVVTLMFGWSLAVIALSLASLATALMAGGLEALSVNALLLGVLPVTVSYGIWRLVSGYLPHHVFVYIFLCAFVAAILAAGSAVLALAGLLLAAEAAPAWRVTDEYLPFLPLYLFPEGVLNGMLTTVFVGLRPQWLATFDDESYLKR